jgi:hypothetical protein
MRTYPRNVLQGPITTFSDTRRANPRSSLLPKPTMEFQAKPSLTKEEINALAGQNTIVNRNCRLNLNGASIQFATLRDCTSSYIHASNCVIIGGSVTNSTFNNCTLVECKLENTKATDSRLNGCTLFYSSISGAGSEISASKARDSKFFGVSIKFSSICRSKILGGNILKSKIQTTEVKGITAGFCCGFLNCDIEISNLSCCSVAECKFSSMSTEDCDITTAPLAFRKFPPEIRAAIFKEAPTVQLMVALRADTELYHEAMPIFSKSIPLIITAENQNEVYIKSLPVSTLENVQSVSVR